MTTAEKTTETLAPVPHELEDQKKASDYTVVFIADSRASTIALGETVKHLINSRSVQRAVVDLRTDVGRTIAAELKSLGVPYDLMVFADTDTDSTLEADDGNDELAAAAEQRIQVSVDDLHALDANYVVIPAMHGSGHHRIDPRVDANAGPDISPTTLPGVVLSRFNSGTEILSAEVLYIDTPEHGLVQEADGSYQRRLFLMSFDDSEDDLQS